MIGLAAYTKGGLGDVRLMPESEVLMWCDAMGVHNALVHAEMKKEMQKAREGGE